MKRIETIHLNYDWKYADTFDAKYIEEFPKHDVVQIPHTNVETPFNNFSEKIYQFASSYEKVIELTPKKNKRYFLHFEGVMAYAEVFVNGKKVVTHKGGYTPFKADITKEIVSGENKIFVMVDSTERDDIPPHGFVVDYLTYGGIYREVYITEEEINRIDNAFVDVLGEQVRIRLFLDVPKPVSTIFTFKILKDEKVIKEFQREYPLKSKEVQVNESVKLEDWTLDKPELYELEIYMAKKLAFSTRFAKRLVKMTTEGFFLNGVNIKLRGLNRHQSFPYVGYAMPSNAQRKDADFCKYELGLNSVRSSHYPPSKHFLDRCDEIGLLVFNEIPGWQHIGDEAWQEVAIENTREMIYRDYNHPSIFIWGVRINESQDLDRFYQKTNDLARSLDDTRPTGGVRYIDNSSLLEDVYTFNDFVHRGFNEGVRDPKKVHKYNKPHLVTEYNGHMYPTKKYDDEFHRVYHARRHYKVQQDSYANNRIAGAMGWCMFDYNTHKDFGSGDRICYHGVMDMFRIPKYAASVYRSQSDHAPYMEVLSNMNIGDLEAGERREIYIATNADYIKLYKGENFIDNFYPSSEYSALPHPPIIISDFIGKQIHDNEQFTEKEADAIKEVLVTVATKGLHKVAPWKLLKVRNILKKYGLTNKDAEDIYTKYIGGWGSEATTFKFEAYKNSQIVLSKEIGQTHESDLVVSVDDEELSETNTYQTTRVVVEHVDALHNLLHYSTEIVDIKIKGPLKLIGPNRLTLFGGSTGFWVKSTGKTGKAEISISSKNFKAKKLSIEVK